MKIDHQTLNKLSFVEPPRANASDRSGFESLLRDAAVSAPSDQRIEPTGRRRDDPPRGDVNSRERSAGHADRSDDQTSAGPKDDSSAKVDAGKAKPDATNDADAEVSVPQAEPVDSAPPADAVVDAQPAGAAAASPSTAPPTAPPTASPSASAQDAAPSTSTSSGPAQASNSNGQHATIPVAVQPVADGGQSVTQVADETKGASPKSTPPPPTPPAPPAQAAVPPQQGDPATATPPRPASAAERPASPPPTALQADGASDPVSPQANRGQTANDTGAQQQQSNGQQQARPDSPPPRAPSAPQGTSTGSEPPARPQPIDDAPPAAPTTSAGADASSNTAPRPVAAAEAAASYATTQMPSAGPEEASTPAPGPTPSATITPSATPATTMSTADAALLDGPDGQQVTDRVVRGLQGAVNQRGGTVTIRLTPPELGALRIRVHLDGGVVRASFETAHQQVGQLLQQQMATLRQALEGRGLTVENLQVQTQGPTGLTTVTAQHNADGSTNDGRSRGAMYQQANQQREDSQQQNPDQPRRGFQEELLDLVA